MKNERYDFPEQYYWAAEDQDFEKLVSYLNDKTELFEETLKDSVLYNRIRRNFEYYHNLFYKQDGDHGDLELQVFGEDGQFVGLTVNHFRSLLQQIATLVTQYKPAWDTKAVNTDPESLQQTRLGNAVLDYYMHFRQLDKTIRHSVEHALVFNVGYVYTRWDQRGGTEGEPDLMTGEMQKVGDVAYSTPYYCDVVYDLSCRSWDEVQWVRIRVPTNKWDLIARYPELKEDILEQCDEDDEDLKSYKSQDFRHYEDRVDVWHFYHIKTEAMPFGRYVQTIGDLLLEDRDWQDELPLDRVTAGEYLMSCVGYSVANDLQGIQEGLNGEVSTVLTTHKALGFGNIYVGPAGTEFKDQVLGDSLRILYADVKPEAVELIQTPAEQFKMLELMPMWMEILSGVNSVARGQPEANLKSGTALALIDQKAQQAASYLEAQKNSLLEGVGTKTLRNLARYGGSSPRTLAIVGKFNRVYMDQFVASELQVVDRVMVQSANALAKTPSGRKAIAEDLLSKGLIRTPEEYFNVLQTGQIETMIEGEMAELSLIREENASLLDGQPAVALATDHHLLHIREHHALMGSSKMRMSPLAQNVVVHIMHHLNELAKPGTQLLQIALGYQVPGPFVQMGAAMAGSGDMSLPPSNGGAPSSEVPMEGSGNPEGRPEAMAPPPRVPAPGPM